MTEVDRGEVGYILMGYPRLSETFISNEIHLLETMGMKLQLYAVKHGGEPAVNSVIAKIEAQPHYLPKVTSVSKTRLLSWLGTNFPKFTRHHWRLLRARPGAYLATLGVALGMCWQYRESAWSKPKKVYIKEFVQAGYIAAEILSSGQIRHLHGHFCHGVANITWFVSRMTGIAFSFTAHAKDIYQLRWNPKDLLERKLDAARFVATCTAANQAYLDRRHPERGKVHTIYHGLDTEMFSPAAGTGDQAAMPQAATPVILSVGRFVEKKGFNYLVEACAQLQREQIDFKCRIVGERGDERDDRFDQIENLVMAHNLQGKVNLQGAVTQEELRSIYRQASLFVLPCQVNSDGDRDGIPNVLVEAMAMGVPIVSTPISGIPELVDDGIDGVLVPERNAAALADAMKGLLADAPRRERLKAAARRKVCRDFSSHVTTRALRDLFAESIAACEAVR
ncbi:MAG: glycosyltransferase family 4 protein [Gammaproteobacteria bacterium]